MSAARTYSRPRRELVEELQRQIAYLERSAAAFDAGHEDEAARLAVTVRVLLSDGASGKALLVQLGLRDQLAYVDTSLSHRRLRADHPGRDAGLAAMEIVAGRGGRYVAMLDELRSDRRRPGVPFGMWWNKKIYRRLSRRDLVAGLANQDGGAHVDASLTDAYAELTRLNGLGWECDGVPFEGNAARASMRQMTWELLRTLELQISVDGTFIGPSRPPARNDPCLCGSGEKFKRCCGA